MQWRFGVAGNSLTGIYGTHQMIITAQAKDTDHQTVQPFILSYEPCNLYLNLVIKYFYFYFIQTYAPSVFEKYMTTVKHGGKEIQLNLYDTAGTHTYTPLPFFILHSLEFNTGQ